MGSAENVSAAEAVVVAPATTDSDVVHVAIEHGQGSGRMLREELKQFLALTQIGFNALSPGDVLDRAAHQDGIAAGVAFDAPTGMNPATFVVVAADDAILVIEELAPAKDFLSKMCRHHVAIVGVNKRHPAFVRVFGFGTDAEDSIEDLGRGPEPGL